MAERQKNALISVWDKSGIVPFADGLAHEGFKIFASKGTAAQLNQEGITATDVAELVGGGPILGHRVVTLSREVHAGLLADPTSKDDMSEIDALGIPFIDLAAVDMYPLREALADPKATEEMIIDKTDIGGPTILRAAAKGRRIVLSRAEQRPEVIEWLKAGQPDDQEFRRHLAAIAEYEAAAYILESAKYLGGKAVFGFMGERVATPKYGENPWQGNAGVYEASDNKNPLAASRYTHHTGPEPSYNNYREFGERASQTLNHIAAGFERNFSYAPDIAIGLKHGNACSAAYGESPADALKKMLKSNPRALYGGTVTVNFELDEELANILLFHGQPEGKRQFLELVTAAGATPEAIKLLGVSERLKLLTNPALRRAGLDTLDKSLRVKSMPGGVIVQDNYDFVPMLSDMKISAGRWMSSQQEKDLMLGWGVCATSNSNTITAISEDGILIGNGTGQQDRVGAAELCIKIVRESGHDFARALVVSDSFFPFPDGPEALVAAGASVIFAPSGSNNDERVFKRMKEVGVQSFITMPNDKARMFYDH